MNTLPEALTEQLKQTCRLVGARWAVWLRRTESAWDFYTQVALTRVRRTALLEFLATPEVTTWISGALSSGYMRSRDPGRRAQGLDCARLYLFPNARHPSALLVGADELSHQEQGFLRVLALQAPEDVPAGPVQGLESPVSEVLSRPQFDLLNELVASTASGAEVDRIARRVVESIQHTFHTDSAAVLLLNPDETSLREYGVHADRAVVDIPVACSLSGYVVETGQAIRIGNIRQAPRYWGEPGEVQSTLDAPLKYQGRVIGVIAVESHQQNAFTLQDEQLLVLIASQLAGLFEYVRLNQANRERLRNLRLIHQIVQGVVGLTGWIEIAQRTAELMASYFHYEFVIILIADEENRYLINLGVGGEMAHILPRGQRYPIHMGLTGRIFQSGQGQYVNDVSQAPEYMPIGDWWAGSEMCTPLRDGERVFGLINLERAQKNAFNEYDLLLLESLAGILSNIMVNARQYEQLQSKVLQLQAARETALDLSSDLDLNALFRRVVHRALELTGARGAALGLVDNERRVVTILVAEEIMAHLMGTPIAFMEGVSGRVAVLGETLRIADYRHWEGRLLLEERAPFTAVACVPLKWKETVMGVLVIADDRTGRVFKDEEIRLMELLAPQVAISIRNARLYQELEERMEAQHQAERKLIYAARLAALGELAAGVAHEINNPLTTIAGFTELALDELPVDLPQRHELKIVLSETQRAREVVRRLLDFARQGDNTRLLTNLNSLVEAILALVQHQAQVANIVIETHLAQELPWTLVDPNQIKQVFLNLVQNGLQAMPMGGRLMLGTEQRWLDQKEWLTFYVHDTGEGIAPDLLDRIYEPFFTTRPFGKGVGLGLSISYGIVMDHGGRLDVESQPGKGSSFTVWLPLTQGEMNG